MSDTSANDRAVFLALCEQARHDSLLFANLQLSVSAGETTEDDDVPLVSPHPMHEFIHLLIDLCEKSKRGLNPVIIMPPGMGKTTTVAQRLVWEQGHFPHHRTALVSANENRTFETMTWIRNAFLNPVTQTVFPDLIPDVDRSKDGRGGGWSNSFLYFKGQDFAAFQAKKFMGAIEGGRFDRILADDTVTEDCKDSVVIRERTHKKLVRSWFRRVNNHRSRVFVLNNVWHPEDTIHKLIDNPGFSVFWLGYEGTERMWWKVHNPPEGWPHETEGNFDLWVNLPESKLRGIYAEDASVYRHLYEGRALADEDRVFPPRDEWGEYDAIPGPDEGGRIFAFMDPAGGKNIHKNCYAAYVLVMMTPKREILVLDCKVDRAPVNRQLVWPFEMAAKWARRGYRVWATGVEALSKEDDWILPRFDEERDRRRAAGEFWEANIEGRRPHENKESRIQALIPAFAHHQILFPKGFRDKVKGGGAEAAHWRHLVDQTEYYRGAQTGFVDAPDALAGAVEMARAMGPSLWLTSEKKKALPLSPSEAALEEIIDAQVFHASKTRQVQRRDAIPLTVGGGDSFIESLYA